MAEGEDLEDPGDGPGAFVISVNSWFSEAFSLICLKLNFGLAPVVSVVIGGPVPVPVAISQGPAWFTAWYLAGVCAGKLWLGELCSGAVSVVIGVPVIISRGERSIFEKGFGVIAEPPG